MVSSSVLFKKLILDFSIVALFSAGNGGLWSCNAQKNQVYKGDVLANNKFRIDYSMVDPGNLGNFLWEAGSTISFTYVGSELSTLDDPFPNDNSHGYIFDRHAYDSSGAMYGLWSYVFQAGWVRVSYKYDPNTGEEDDVMNCPYMLPPNATDPVLYELTVGDGGAVTLTVGDKICEGTLPTNLFPDDTDFRISPIMFGAAHDVLDQNIHGEIKDVKLYNSAGKLGRLKRIKNTGFIFKTKWFGGKN